MGILSLSFLSSLSPEPLLFSPSPFHPLFPFILIFYNLFSSSPSSLFPFSFLTIQPRLPTLSGLYPPSFRPIEISRTTLTQDPSLPVHRRDRRRSEFSRGLNNSATRQRQTFSKSSRDTGSKCVCVCGLLVLFVHVE